MSRFWRDNYPHIARNSKKIMKPDAHWHDEIACYGAHIPYDALFADDNSVSIHEEYSETRHQRLVEEQKTFKTVVEVANAANQMTTPGLEQQSSDQRNKVLDNRSYGLECQKQWRAHSRNVEFAYCGVCEVEEQLILVESGNDGEVRNAGDGEGDDEPNEGADFDAGLFKIAEVRWGDEVASYEPECASACWDSVMEATALFDMPAPKHNEVVVDKDIASSHDILPPRSRYAMVQASHDMWRPPNVVHPKNRYAMVQASHDMWTPPGRAFPFGDNFTPTEAPRRLRSLDYGDACDATRRHAHSLVDQDLRGLRELVVANNARKLEFGPSLWFQECGCWARHTKDFEASYFAV